MRWYIKKLVFYNFTYKVLVIYIPKFSRFLFIYQKISILHNYLLLYIFT